jgi:hypothetical protein
VVVDEDMPIQNTSVCWWKNKWQRRRGRGGVGVEAWEWRRGRGGAGAETGCDLDDNISGVEVKEGIAGGRQPVYHHPNTRENLNCRNPLHP